MMAVGDAAELLVEREARIAAQRCAKEAADLAAKRLHSAQLWQSVAIGLAITVVGLMTATVFALAWRVVG